MQDIRQLAYEYGEANNVKLPESWTENKAAGKDWGEAFMGRHPELSLRTMEATSLQRMACFNRPNVKKIL